MARRRPKSEPDTLAATRAMIRTAADERAVKAGCRFDPEMAAYVCGWIEGKCCLYEGHRAGKLFKLMPFQREYISQLFGWRVWSTEWGCWIRRFTHGAFWAAKKNGKSPLAAAVNLYQLIGDGEEGQKVYQAAKNGEQARIAQKHAVQMVKKSEELLADCKINNSTLAITYLPTNSELTILTGDDERGAKAKEGLNGSVTFDEMHVVDAQMYERVLGAGISRRQPLLLSWSTAGDDPSSVGYERCQYGRQVNSGERDDISFLHVEYSIPDDVTEADIAADPERYGRMANPAWGELVKPTEFRAFWERAKGNTRLTARALQYRFNRWIGSANRWLDVSGWGLGKRSFSLPDLAGRDCFGAIDLSRTRDMTAFVLTFPDEGEESVRVWPRFWLPEQTAKERDHLFPFLTWAKRGFLTLTPGGVVDYGRVKRDIREMVRANNLKLLKWFFDPHYAEEITQQLADGEQFEGVFIPGIGGERVTFSQTITTFGAPAKEFERRVSVGLVHHPDNPVMNWQVGHCEVKDDVNQNIRPVKPKPNSGKSVDGVVAAVMSFAELLVQPEEQYASPTVWTL